MKHTPLELAERGAMPGQKLINALLHNYCPKKTTTVA
jgi:hypothetical protein